MKYQYGDKIIIKESSSRYTGLKGRISYIYNKTNYYSVDIPSLQQVVTFRDTQLKPDINIFELWENTCADN
jgi:hypothetical protein